MFVPFLLCGIRKLNKFQQHLDIRYGKWISEILNYYEMENECDRIYMANYIGSYSMQNVRESIYDLSTIREICRVQENLGLCISHKWQQTVPHSFTLLIRHTHTHTQINLNCHQLNQQQQRRHNDVGKSVWTNLVYTVYCIHEIEKFCQKYSKYFCTFWSIIYRSVWFGVNCLFCTAKFITFSSVCWLASTFTKSPRVFSLLPMWL